MLPVLGAIADYTHLKKTLMAVFCYAGAIATGLMFFVERRPAAVRRRVPHRREHLRSAARWSSTTPS